MDTEIECKLCATFLNNIYSSNLMSNSAIGVRIPPNLQKRLESHIAETHSTRTEVILNALAQYLGASEEVPLTQRVSALEAQILELKGLVKLKFRLRI
jgi:hypothetical protein